MADLHRPSKPWWSPLAWVGILLLAFALRVYRLGADSLWYDETVSALLARKPLAAMWAHTARDIHPPLYYALLHGWQQLAGTSEYSLAFLSVWFGVAGVALVGYLGQRMFSTRVGWLAALLMAFNPFSIWYAQEVRMYTLGVCLILLTLKWSLDFLAQPPSASSGRAPWRPLLGYAITAALLLWTLYYSAFALVALNLAVLAWLTWRYPRGWLPWLAAQALALLLYLPWLPHALQQALHPPVPPWRESLPLLALLQKLGMEGVTALSLGQSVAPQVWWILGFTTLVIALLAFRQTPSRHCVLQQPWTAGFLWTLLAGPVILILLLSQLVTPLYHVRYLNLYSGPFPILLAAGLMSLARMRLKTSHPASQRPNHGDQPFPLGFFLAGVLFFLLVAASLISLKHFHTQRYTYEAADDLRGAVQTIHQHLGPRDAILINAGHLYPAFLVYWPDPIEWIGRLSEYPPPPDDVGPGPMVVMTGFVDGSPDIGWGDPQSDFFAISRAETEERLLRLFQDHNTIWQLRGYDTVNDPQGVIRSWLDYHGELIFDQVFPGTSYVRVQGWRTAPVRGGQPLWPPQHPLQATFEDGIRLEGFDNTPTGDTPLRLTLYWQALARPSRSYKAYVHWLTEDWHMVAQDDVLPGFGALSTETWEPGQIIETNFVLFPPTDLPPGTYRLVTGFYDAQTGQRLPLTQGESEVTLTLFDYAP